MKNFWPKNHANVSKKLNIDGEQFHLAKLKLCK